MLILNIWSQEMPEKKIKAQSCIIVAGLEYFTLYYHAESPSPRSIRSNHLQGTGKCLWFGYNSGEYLPILALHTRCVLCHLITKRLAYACNRATTLACVHLSCLLYKGWTRLQWGYNSSWCSPTLAFYARYVSSTGDCLPLPCAGTYLQDIPVC